MAPSVKVNYEKNRPCLSAIFARATPVELNSLKLRKLEIRNRI